MKLEISASLLAADFSRLGDELKKASDAGVDRIHIDAIDGRFAPNITFGPQMVMALRKYSKLPFEIHMMVENPERFIASYVESGADIIIIHAEADYNTPNTPNMRESLRKIKELGIKAGIALKPDTPVSVIENFIPDSDLILPMSVNPGFSGQKFIEKVLDKMASIKLLMKILENEKKMEIDLEADGGVNTATAPLVFKAGANVLVCGAAVFKTENMQKAVEKIRESAIKMNK